MLIKRILLPTAFAEPSHRAVPYARELAMQFGCELHVVHVVEDPWPMPVTESAPMGYTTPMLAPVPDRAELIASAQADVQRFAEAEFAGCPRVITQVISDNIAAGLAEYARANAIDMIVMGTHSSGLWHRIFHGSVGERVLEPVDCPVLLVPVRE